MPLRRALVAVALGLAVIAAAATPASAHALLLRAEPSPQSTVPTAPTVVRLFFSEPVEVAPSDVRVYDVDGKRVDKGTARRVSGNREVDAAVPHLADGTYTVTWRAVSEDSHPVHGGFVFYVGHASTISAVAISGDHGASRAVGVAFGVDRFLWFSALLLIVGLVTVRRWAWTPAVREAGLIESAGAQRFRRLFSRALPTAWLVLAVATLVALAFQSATVSGRAFLDSLGGDQLRQVFHSTYGHFWTLELVLVAALALPVAGLARRTRLLNAPPDLWIGLGGVIVVALCATAALSGHARTDSSPALSVVSVAVHLLAVGVWVGGVAALVMVARPAWRAVAGDDRRVIVRGVVARYSRLAVAAVAVVVVTGTVSSVLGFHAVSDLWRVPYGRVVTAKVILLALALVVAARHRFVTPRRLSGPDSGREVGAFASWTGAELTALLGAVALAAGLVAMVPGRTVALAANGPVNAEHKAGDYTVQLIVDPTRTGRNDVHVTWVNSSGLAAAEVATTDVTLTMPSRSAAPIAMRLISGGHFVGEGDLPVTGRYEIGVRAPQGSTTFTFTIRKGA